MDSEYETKIAFETVNQDDQIKTFHPKSFSDGRNIGEAFRTGKVVIMNCTEMSEVESKRIVDFVSGLIFASGGSIKRVANKVFLLTPSQDVVKYSNIDKNVNQSLSS
jgi:cell division inhibitor SepF